MKTTQNTLSDYKSLFFGIMVVGVMLAVVGTAAAATTTTVSLTPDNETVEPGQEVTFDVVVDPIDGGVDSYEFDAAVDSESAEITDVTLVGTTSDDTLTSVDYMNNNTSVSVAAAHADHDNGTIASITIQVTEPGSTSISLSNVAVGDSNANSYVIESTEPSTIKTVKPSVDVSVLPSKKGVPQDGQAKVDISVSGADSGIGSYEFDVRLENDSIASIEDVSLIGTNKSDGLTSISITEGSQVSVSAAAVDEVDEKIATLQLVGIQAGNTTVELTNVTIGNEDGSYAYNISNAGESELQVEKPPSSVVEEDPSDPDGDGTFEDVNGDDEFNIVDVQALLQNKDEEAIQDNDLFFDFNGDGNIDIVDVQALYQLAL